MRRAKGNADACIVWADLARPGEDARMAADRFAAELGGRSVGEWSGDCFRLVDGVKVYRVELTPKAVDGRAVWTVYETHRVMPRQGGRGGP